MEYLPMFRILLSAAILLGAASTPLAARAATPSQLKSVKIDLPDSDKMFPDGPGSDAINNNCLACHSADMVLNQPALSKQAWAAEVNKMINNYKAPVAPEDVATIVDYLTSLKGAK
jgi:cytochrome c5